MMPTCIFDFPSTGDIEGLRDKFGKIVDFEDNGETTGEKESPFLNTLINEVDGMIC